MALFTLLLSFVFGAVAGSFFLCWAHRKKSGMTVMEPRRSFCPQCDATLTAMENVPILSYIALKGKCAHCGQAIGVEYVLAEVLTGLAFAGVGSLLI